MNTLGKRALLIGVAASAIGLASTFGLAAAGNGTDRSCGETRRAQDPGGNSAANRKLEVIGLTDDGRLICFSEDEPDEATVLGQVTGLTGDTSLVGIDFRPSNGALYGVGNASGLYTIDPATALATKVDTLDIALSGASFGVDVNPAADALRIISDTGQNLRHSFASGTTFMDTALAYPPNAAAGVVGAAYTNNDGDAITATTLFDIDSMLDQVAIQSPANSGQLVATGKLRADTSAEVGFDIYSIIRGGSTVEVRALASLTVGGESGLYRINLLTGRATASGAFAADHDVISIAIPLDQI